MAEYVFPAIFTAEKCGYAIDFPDVENCFTSAKTLIEGVKMASDVLCLVLREMETNDEPIPQPSDIQDIAVANNSFVSLIFCDTENDK